MSLFSSINIRYAIMYFRSVAVGVMKTIVEVADMHKAHIMITIEIFIFTFRKMLLRRKFLLLRLS